MLKRLDHIGIVVDDMASAKRFLGEVLGLPMTREAEIPERGIKIAFFSLGNAEIELIESTDAAGRAQRLGNAAARIEHIAVNVDDLNAAAEQLRSRGVQMASREPVVNAGRAMYFTVPETCDGVTYQLIQPAATSS